MFTFDSIYLVYLLIGVSAAMFAEGLYLLVFNNASYRKNINRRLKVMDGKTDRESVLLQSGLTIGFGRLILFIVMGATATFAAMIAFEGNAFHAILATLFSGLVLPPFVLRILRNRRQKKFSAQFPDGIDIIVRSLRAGHPVPIAIAMVSKEMPDPIGTDSAI